MILAIAVFLILIVLVQMYNFVYWVLTELHLTAAYRTSTEAILKDMGYTMSEYLNDSYIRHVVTNEFINRLGK